MTWIYEKKESSKKIVLAETAGVEAANNCYQGGILRDIR